MIAARQIAFGKAAGKGLSAKDYIQDGLVAMWDGIENAGWGTHDPSATVWKDLSENGHDLIIGAGEFGNNYFNAGGTNYANLDYALDYYTTEAVVMTSNLSSRLTIGNNLIISGDGGNYGRNLSLSKVGIYRAVVNSIGKAFDATISNGMIYSISVGGSAWLNGVELLESSTAGNLNNYSPGKLTQVGWRKRDNSESASDGSGLIHNLRLYNRDLTAEEIAYNYNIDKARFGL